MHELCIRREKYVVPQLFLVVSIQSLSSLFFSFIHNVRTLYMCRRVLTVHCVLSIVRQRVYTYRGASEWKKHTALCILLNNPIICTFNQLLHFTIYCYRFGFDGGGGSSRGGNSEQQKQWWRYGVCCCRLNIALFCFVLLLPSLLFLFPWISCLRTHTSTIIPRSHCLGRVVYVCMCFRAFFTSYSIVTLPFSSLKAFRCVHSVTTYI